MTIGDRIRNLRKNYGWTQQQLAEKIDVTKSAIGSYEQDRRKPSLEVLRKLADSFDVTTDYLVGKSNFKQDPHSKIKQALEDDPELLSFWQMMGDREDLQLLFKQTKDLSPESIKSVVHFMKSIEDDHKRNPAR